MGSPWRKRGAAAFAAASAAVTPRPHCHFAACARQRNERSALVRRFADAAAELRKQSVHEAPSKTQARKKQVSWETGAWSGAFQIEDTHLVLPPFLLLLR